jgi:hypothetical protein
MWGSALAVDTEGALAGHYDEPVVLQLLKPVGDEVLMGFDHQRRVADGEEDAAVVARFSVIAALKRDIEVSSSVRHRPPCGRIHHIVIHLHE